VPNPLLSLMMFPQRWKPGTGALDIRVAALPFTDPLSPLIGAEPAFGDTDLAFQARIIPSLKHLPKSADADPPLILPVSARLNRRALLEQLRARFKIAVPPPAPAGSRRVKKYLPVSYREAFDFQRPQHEFVATDRAYRCAFETAQTADPNFMPEDRVSWGEILGYVLRNRLMAEEGGLFFDFEITPGEAFTAGGWLYGELQPGSTYAGLAGESVSRRYSCAGRDSPASVCRHPVSSGRSGSQR